MTQDGSLVTGDDGYDTIQTNQTPVLLSGHSMGRKLVLTLNLKLNILSSNTHVQQGEKRRVRSVSVPQLNGN